MIALLMIGSILLINWKFGLITVTRMRYFLLVWFILVTLFAYGIASLPRWRIVATVFLSIWSIAGLQFNRSGEVVRFAGLMADARQYPPLQDYVIQLKGKVQPRDYLVGFSGDDSINRVSRYSSNSTSDYYLLTQLGMDGVFIHSHLKRYRLDSDVREILDAHPHILLAHDPSDVPLNYAKVLEQTQEDYVPCAALVDEPDLLIRRFTHPLMDCDHEPTSIYYENGMKIVDYVARYETSVERIQALTWWDVPDANMLDEYNVSFQIVTPDWRNVRQIDRHLYDKLLPWNVIEITTTDLPTGEYRLMLVLYRRDTGETIGGVENADSISSDIIPLLTFEIPS